MNLTNVITFKRENCITKKRLHDSESNLRKYLDRYAKKSFLEPGMTKDYFEDFFCTNLFGLMHKAFPDETFKKGKNRYIDAVNKYLKKKGLPYGVIFMSELYSDNRFYYYIFKKGNY